MKTNITLEKAMDKARPGLRYRIEQSVLLLKKAERIAKMYDPEDGFYLAFSGGKDSQALYHVAELSGVSFKAHFSPTTVDPPQLMKFIRRNYPECEWGKVDKSMYQVAKEMGMVPTMKLRWCCAKFKESSGAGKVTLTGVRHAESIKRAKRKAVEVSGHKFAGDLEEFLDWSEEKREKIAKRVKNLNQDEFSRDKQQEIRCINGKDSIIINPIIDWTDADVWDFLNKVMEVPHCELYDPPFNRHRIGCILCPMSSYKTKLRDIELYPYAKKEWLKVFEYFIGGYDPGFTLRKREKSESGVHDTGVQYRAYKKNLAEQTYRGLPPVQSINRCGSIQCGQQNCPPPEGRTKNGKPRWAGVSMSAEVLFGWWLTHDSWETFKANLEHPKLFDNEDD